MTDEHHGSEHDRRHENAVNANIDLRHACERKRAVRKSDRRSYWVMVISAILRFG